MTYLRESFCYQMWLTLLSVYDQSILHRCLVRLGAWCNARVDESRILRVLCRQGAVARSWQESLACRAVIFLINLPAWLLHKLYGAFRMTFEDSFFARLAFSMGDETAIAQSWMIMLLWVIPFSHWNNAYSLMGFVLLLALFYVGAMHQERFRLDAANIGFYPMLLFGVEDLKRLAAGGGVCVLVSSLYGVYQRIQGVEVNESYVDMTVNAGMPGRVESYFDNPNTFAEVLILLLPLVLALVLCSRRWYSRLIACGVAVVGVAALGMTYSRASWVGAACAMVVFVFLWKPKLIPGFAVLCVLCIPFLPDTIWNRILTITNISDSSTASRIPLYEAALEVIKKSPVTGAGLGTAATQTYISDFNLYHGEAPFVHAHNFYLQVWIEAGLLGIIGFVGGMLWNIKRAAYVVRHCEDSAARTITCAAASALCGAMVCGLADYLWNYPRVMCIFWFVFAMAIAGTKLCRTKFT